MSKHALAWALAFLLPAVARADVLFVDLNASYHEIEAAEAAAKRSGRKFEAFPPMSKEDRKALYTITQSLPALEVKTMRDCKSPDSPACLKAKVAESALQTRLHGIRDKSHFDKDKFAAFLAEKKKAGREFSSVVVSGHNGTGTLSGHLGRVDDEALASALIKAGFQNSVRALHLWGCYTASPGSVMINWKPKFPNVGFISGYDDRAPLSDKPAGWAYLKGVIEREPELTKIADAKKLQEALRKIPGAIQVSSAVSNCGFYANNKEAYDLEDYFGQCQKYKGELEKRLDRFECYLQATSDECANPPENTGSGVLREYYGIQQKTLPCAKILDNDPTFTMHSRDQALNLLFHRNVLANLARSHAKELQEADELLANLQAPSDLRLSGIGSLDRKTALAKLDQLLGFLRDKMPALAVNPAKFVIDSHTAQLSALLRTHEWLTKSLAKLPEACVPYPWHEGNSNVRSGCLKPELVGRAGVLTALENGDKTRLPLLQQYTEKMRRELSDNLVPGDAYDRLLFRARLDAVDAVSDASDMRDDKQSSQETLAWAETVTKLKRSGIEDPINHPEARLSHYRNVMAQNVRSIESEESDASQKRAAEKINEALRARIAALESNQSPESSSHESAFSTAKAAALEILFEQEKKSVGAFLRRYEDRLEELKAERAPLRRIREMEKRILPYRRRQQRIDDKAAFVKEKLWEKAVETPPLKLETPALEPQISPPSPEEHE